MAYRRDITADDKVFYDTDNILKFRVWSGDPTAAEIAANTATPQDVTGWTMSWTLRKKAKTADPPLIYKTTSSGIAITGVFNADPLVNTQRVEVTIEDTDTYDVSVSPNVIIKAGMYEHALKRTDTGSEGILTWGTFKLLQAAAWETP